MSRHWDDQVWYPAPYFYLGVPFGLAPKKRCTFPPVKTIYEAKKKLGSCGVYRSALTILYRIFNIKNRKKVDLFNQREGNIITLCTRSSSFVNLMYSQLQWSEYYVVRLREQQQQLYSMGSKKEVEQLALIIIHISICTVL